ncbi:GMC family oxidoreductase [Phenylobacterium sp.]|uniref:GMC family oxidoreductase n=1 Tax=Phenylobacterium sp. TaxID=1871053 RepID=UPI003569BAD4
MTRPEDETFDYIVVGAGASGCAVAGGLAARPGNRIAVLEAGRSRGPKISAIPAATVFTNGNPAFDWCYSAQPDPTRYGRVDAWPRGLGRGGSTRINGMIFVRGAPQDYDAWRGLGATGWSYSDLLPYFRRIESSPFEVSQARGANGPMSVSSLPYVHPLTRPFLAAAAEAGLPTNPDYNGPVQDGVGLVQGTLRRGRRRDAFDAFLRPAVRRGAVALLEGAKAHRVIFEDGRAVAVSFEQDGVMRTLRARRGVVLSGGAINTPQLLMLSGIGDPAKLRDLGIEVVAASPEVGKNLMEHVGVWLGLRVNTPTLNQWATPLGMGAAFLRWLAGGGPASAPTAQAVAFARTLPDQDAPDVQIHMTPFGHVGHGAARRLAAFPMISVVASVSHPKSRGRIALATNDARDAALIFPRLLDHPDDLATLKRGVELCGRIADAPSLRGAVLEKIEWPDLRDGCSEGERQLRLAASPIYHPAGTCRMGEDDRAVVDSQLRVRGVSGLFVADTSIFPRHISGNTQAAAMMIGDRAADLFREHS